MVQMLNEKPKLQQLTVKPFKIGGYEMRTCEYGTYFAYMKEEKEMKETNLQHYKEQLKEIFSKYYEQPQKMVDKIADNIDCKVRALDYWICTDEILEWMAQPYEKHILDEVERKYLSDVIRPFRKEVATISKFRTWANDAHYIYIEMKDNRGCTLPFFPKNTMYKGMEDGRHYSLKELGL